MYFETLKFKVDSRCFSYLPYCYSGCKILHVFLYSSHEIKHYYGVKLENSDSEQSLFFEGHITIHITYRDKKYIKINKVSRDFSISMNECKGDRDINLFEEEVVFPANAEWIKVKAIIQPKFIAYGRTLCEDDF